MQARVSSIRITGRKVMTIVDQVRGKMVNDAFRILSGSPKKRTASVVFKVLKSAVANADQKGTVDVDNLYIKTILVGGGTILKRFRPRAKGSAFPIQKRTSNITVTLAEK